MSEIADCLVTEIRVVNLNGAFSKEDGKPGVYCWGYYNADTFIPLYVGKSRNVHERLLQHYCRFKKREYRIFYINYLHDIYITKSSSKPELDSIYVPTCFQKVIEDLP